MQSRFHDDDGKTVFGLIPKCISWKDESENTRTQIHAYKFQVKMMNRQNDGKIGVNQVFVQLTPFWNQIFPTDLFI